MVIELFDRYAHLFEKNGFHLFLVGGSTRDYLLDLPIVDYDFATDATPEEMAKFLPEANLTFSRYGAVSIKPCVFTTLRIEGHYDDYRHPSFIKYVNDPKLDYVRRDFTINAIYLTSKYEILDFCDGVKDLHERVLRFIGNPETRVKEDPLRILRGERFARKYGLRIENDTYLAMNKYRILLNKINPQKIEEEMRKQKK